MRLHMRKMLLGLVLVVLLILMLLPMAISFATVSWLEAHGVKDAQIENIDLNLFTGKLSVDGLRADDGLTIESFKMDVDWLPLLNNILHIRSFELKGSHFQVLENKGLWQLANIKPDVEVTADEASTEEGEEAEPWSVVVDDLVFQDVYAQVNASQFLLLLPITSLQLVLSSELDGSQKLKETLVLGETAFAGFGYQLNYEQLKLSSSLSFSLLADDVLASLFGREIKLNIQRLGLQDDTGNSFAKIKSFSLENIEIQGAQQSSFETLRIEGVELPTNEEGTLGHLALIQADDAKLDMAGEYRLNRLSISGLNTDIVQQKNGKMQVVNRLLQVKQAPKAKNTADKKEDGGNQAKNKQLIVIDEIIFEKSNHIHFRDESVLPILDLDIDIKAFNLLDLNTSGDQMAQLDTELQVGETGSLRLNGAFMPLAGKDFATQMKLLIQAFDLSQLSGYIEPDIGRSIEVGQFNLDSDVQISKNQIQAKNTVLIRKLELGDAKQAKEANMELGMPIDVALSMLTDSDGDIHLDIPVEGALDDPDVSLHSIINKAVVSTVQAGALTYAVLALQPYGAIVVAADMANDMVQNARKPSFTPIVFEARSIVLSDDMSGYVGKISGLLKEKDLNLQICGVATQIEGAAVEEGSSVNQKHALAVMDDAALYALATARSDAVVKALQDNGVAAKQLFACRPQIDKAEPRVDLLID